MAEPTHFADRLLAAIDQKGSPVCVGIDPNPARLPEEFQTDPSDPMATLEAVGAWSATVLNIVAPYVPAVKPQVAYFEQLPGPQPFSGMAIYAAVIEAARNMGLVVIGDAKRGDIGSTAQAYAAAHLGGEQSADALTVNAYFGEDGLAPFVDAARQGGRGLFALVRTSNPSAAGIQDVEDANGNPFYQRLAARMAELGAADGMVSASGYSLLGAVVGATWPDQARQLRQIMPQQIFLVPGYGAQGATAEDCTASFKGDGTGAIVNASRSVIYAHQREEYEGLDWKQAVERAAKDFAADIARAVGRA